MKSVLAYTVPVLMSLVLFGCMNQSSNPVDNNIFSAGRLYKSQIDSSSHLPLNTINDSTKTFGYDNYQFTLKISKLDPSHNIIHILVNDSTIANTYWQYNCKDSTSGSWLGTKSFSYNGANMSMNVHIPKDTNNVIIYPDSANVIITVYVQPNPITNLSASPSVHRNLHQAVTLNWTVSPDTDVTGYNIYREVNGQTSYSLIKSITSRSTSQWIDSTVNWNSTNAAQYYIKVYDGTHNLLSNVSNYVVSYYVAN